MNNEELKEKIEKEMNNEELKEKNEEIIIEKIDYEEQAAWIITKFILENFEPKKSGESDK
jgi:hypothetical protein